MSSAMGSSWVLMCLGAASWHGGCVMLVLGARAAAGAGSCAGARGSTRFGVVVVCGCSLVAVPAGGAAPVRGLGCGQWWALSWRVVCGVSRGGAGGGGRGVESAWRGFVPVLVGCGVSCPRVGDGGAVWYGCAGLRCGLSAGGGGGTVSRCGGLGGRSWLVLWRCGAAPCGLSVVLLACFSTWAVRGRCRLGPGVPWGGCVGLECRSQGGVVAWCLGVSAHR